ncbi:hypothetical protein DSO57_1024916 [Entomophthora muscae]|uniref:Uncharacterized protein n=1 Tax=Entomophthora muscae TaxID=34485 RepID=A0ACC2SRE7_9FUNG|nr:hypothetical protein DSO57_1024916 [Entomophthora muscae]
MKDFKKLYRKNTSDTSEITKKMVRGDPNILSEKRWHLEEAKHLDWTGKFIEKVNGPGKTKIVWNYVESVLDEDTETTSFLEG